MSKLPCVFSAIVASVHVGGVVAVGASEPAAIDEALETVERYALTLLQTDAQASLSLWHPKAIDKLGGRDEALGILERFAESERKLDASSDVFELAAPVPIATARSRAENPELFLVRANRKTLGYPADIRLPMHFFAARSGNKHSWRIVDTGCVNLEVMSEFFPGFDSNAFEAAMSGPFEVTSTARLAATH